MKSKNLFRKAAPAILLLTLVLGIVLGCKQKTALGVIENDPLPPSSSAITPIKAFENRLPKLISNSELLRGKNYHVKKLDSFGDQLTLGPEIPDGVMQLLDITMIIMDKTNHESADQYHEVMNKLNEISDQIAELDTAIQALRMDLRIQTSELERFIQTETLNTYITNIVTAMSDGSSQGLRYYPKRAAYLKDNNGTAAQWQTLSEDAKTWALGGSGAVGQYWNTKGAINDVAQIHSLLCPDHSQTPQGMMNFAGTLIRAYSNSTVSVTEETVLQAFAIFENYFLTIVNAQYQGACIYANACNVKDTTKWEANNYITTTFAPFIKDEIDVYLYTVDYLAVNIARIANIEQFTKDFHYRTLALGPDRLYFNSLLRARLTTNILLRSLKLNYPRMAGSIITPHYTNNRHKNQNNNVVMKYGSRSDALNSTARNTDGGNLGMSSQYYYASWDNGVCIPDNNWNVYRFGNAYDDNDIPNGGIPITMQENTSTDDPWPHSGQLGKLSGFVNSYFYNPADPTDISSSRRNADDIKLAFFSNRWNWGYPYITSEGENHVGESVNYYMSDWKDGGPYRPNNLIGEGAGFPSAPNVITSTSGAAKLYTHDTGTFSWRPSQPLSFMGYDGSTVNTEWEYIVNNIYYTNMSVGTVPNGLTPYLYGASNSYWNASMPQTQTNRSNTRMINQLGLYKKMYPTSTYAPSIIGCEPFYTNANYIFDHWSPDSGAALKISANSSYEPCAEFQFDAKGTCPSQYTYRYPITTSVENWMQVVFDGNHPN